MSISKWMLCKGLEAKKPKTAESSQMILSSLIISICLDFVADNNSKQIISNL